MILRISSVILFIVFLFGCSNQSSEQITEEILATNNETSLVESNPGNISVVCGALFKVNDFDTWIKAYEKSAEGIIILLRNVDDPSLVLSFEGRQSQDLVEQRAIELMDNKFLKEAGVMGDPVVNYYDVQYMSQSETDYKHYVGLIFEIDDIKQLLAALVRDINVYASYGLVPMGIGTDPIHTNEVYMLLSLDDFVSFRKQTNSPRKIKRFINSLNLPAATTISNWAKTSL